jgi:hypothetical protein
LLTTQVDLENQGSLAAHSVPTESKVSKVELPNPIRVLDPNRFVGADDEHDADPDVVLKDDRE